MTGIVKGIEAQPTFPREDLTDANAAILEMMLSNREFSQLGHIEGERFIPPFQHMHPATVTSVLRVRETAPRSAVDHGAALFETMSLLLAVTPHLEMYTVVRNAAGLVEASSEQTVDDYIVDAHDTFLAETPRAAKVVELSARRFYGTLAIYAQLGAALMRQQELDATVPHAS